jgi:D-alanine transfer protein
MKQTPHLTAAVTSLSIFILVLVGFHVYATRLEDQYVNVIAPLNLPQTVNGIALQRAALQKSDILPVFGSSELTLLSTPYQADKFFAEYPTGFTVLNIANLGILSITLAQDLSALGPDLRGKKIVLSIMPGSFFISKRNFIENNPDHDFAMNFSRLHAYEAIFSPYLSYGIKNQIADRLLHFSKYLQTDPFLEFAVTHTASISLPDRALYYMIWPLGELEIQVLRLQDHAEVVRYIRTSGLNSDVKRVPRTIDWEKAHKDALAEQILNSSTNPYGVEDFMWWYFKRIDLPAPPGSANDTYVKNLLNSAEWSDFKILLQVLKQLGAEPLIVGRPLNVPMWEVMGVSEDTQKIYYSRLHSVADPFGMTLMDMRQYDQEKYFSIDQGSHTSRVGWVYIDQILDAYFHGRLQP